jgi:glycosyltransferase involved in cell wall biosynthesis
MPTVSAVIPTFNRARLLGEAINSALGQSRPPDEIIVVDDGSTDETPARMAAYGPHVRYVRQANQGPSAARNHGFRLATGDYVALLDSDDLWTPDRLERQLHLLSRHPHADVVFGREVLFGAGRAEQDWNLHDPQVREALRAAEGPLAHPLELLLRENMLPTSSVLFRRACLVRTGMIDESLRQAEDWDLWLRFALAGCTFAYVPAPLCRRRMHQDNLIHDWEARTRATLAVLERHLGACGPLRAAAEERCSRLAYDLGSRQLYERRFRAAKATLGQVRPGTARPWILTLKRTAATVMARLSRRS